MMDKLFFIAVLMGVMPLATMAQDDDMYFTPKKESKADASRSGAYNQQPTYYCGSNRDVDEYNRRGRLKSFYQKIGTDSLGNDIIEFHAGDGTYGCDSTDCAVSVYPGSEQYYDDDDYAYTRNMSRFDGFYGWYDPYCYGTWGSPYWRWRYYNGWYDPWYSSWYGWNGWYSPWYYSYYGWGYPHYGWGGWPAPAIHYRYAGPTGTRNHARGNGVFYGNRSNFSTSGNRQGFGSSQYRTNKNSRGEFGQRRSSYNNNINNTNRNQYSAPVQRQNNFGGNTFGGSRGSFGGGAGFGGHSGGSFGGSRGGSFGGRR